MQASCDFWFKIPSQHHWFPDQSWRWVREPLTYALSQSICPICAHRCSFSTNFFLFLSSPSFTLSLLSSWVSSSIALSYDLNKEPSQLFLTLLWLQLPYPVVGSTFTSTKTSQTQYLSQEEYTTSNHSENTDHFEHFISQWIKHHWSGCTNPTSCRPPTLFSPLFSAFEFLHLILISSFSPPLLPSAWLDIQPSVLWMMTMTSQLLWTTTSSHPIHSPFFSNTKRLAALFYNKEKALFFIYFSGAPSIILMQMCCPTFGHPYSSVYSGHTCVPPVPFAWSSLFSLFLLNFCLLFLSQLNHHFFREAFPNFLA